MWNAGWKCSRTHFLITFFKLMDKKWVSPMQLAWVCMTHKRAALTWWTNEHYLPKICQLQHDIFIVCAKYSHCFKFININTLNYCNDDNETDHKKQSSLVWRLLLLLLSIVSLWVCVVVVVFVWYLWSHKFGSMLREHTQSFLSSRFSLICSRHNWHDSILFASATKMA